MDILSGTRILVLSQHREVGLCTVNVRDAGMTASRTDKCLYASKRMLSIGFWFSMYMCSAISNLTLGLDILKPDGCKKK
jgi:hypothetical protein